MVTQLRFVSLELDHADSMKFLPKVVVLFVSQVHTWNKSHHLRYFKDVDFVWILFDFEKDLFEVERSSSWWIWVNIEGKWRILGKCTFIDFFGAYFPYKFYKCFPNFAILEDYDKNEKTLTDTEDVIDCCQWIEIGCWRAGVTIEVK